jgi:hypothetical protein
VGDYLTWVSDVNAQHTTYQNTVNTQYLLRAGGLATADMTHATTLANAVESRDVGIASAEEQYVLTLADPTETYVTDTAQAKRDHRVDLATAERNLAVDGDYEAHTAALATANAEKEDIDRATTRTYVIAEAAAGGTRRVGIVTKRRDFEVTAGGADVTLTATRSAANLSYKTAEANTLAARDINIAGLDAAYWDHQADTYANDMALLAVLNGSPWAEFEADRADADADWVADVSSADLTRTTTQVNAERSRKILAVAADELFANLNAVGRAAYRATTSNAVLAANVLMANADNVRASLGAYSPDMPVVPTPPVIAADPALTAALADLSNYSHVPPYGYCFQCGGGSWGGWWGQGHLYQGRFKSFATLKATLGVRT